MISVNLSENNSFAFEMQIEGSISSINSINLILETKNGYDIRIPTSYSNDQVEVNLPNFKNILSAGEYPVKLEVNIDGKLYTPLQETLKFETEVQVIAKVKQNLTENHFSVSKVTVDNKPKNIPKEIKTEIVEQEVIEEIVQPIIEQPVIKEVIPEKVEVQEPVKEKQKFNFNNFKFK